MQLPPHRKTMHHFNTPGHIHLLTFSCNGRRPLLNNDLWRRWLSGGIDRTFESQKWQLISFVYMPEHIHLLARPTEEQYRVDALLFAIKRPLSYKIKTALLNNDSQLAQDLMVVERPGKTSFRFWQEGGGHDRNLFTTETCIKATEYLHHNPVRRGLCKSPDQWRWSSWKFFHEPDAYSQDAALPRVHGFLG